MTGEQAIVHPARPSAARPGELATPLHAGGTGHSTRPLRAMGREVVQRKKQQALAALVTILSRLTR